MSVEAGATSGIVPADDETRRYLREEAGVTDDIHRVAPDADAVYEQIIDIDVATLEPQVACPHTVDNVMPVSDMAGLKVQPGRHRLLHQRPSGRPGHSRRHPARQDVARGTRMLVFPASWQDLPEAMRSGYLIGLGRRRRCHHESRLRLLPGCAPGRPRRR